MKRQEQIKQLAPVLVPWYEKNRRSLPWREDPTPYHVWLSEIMLQQTRIEAVKPYYSRFLRAVPDIAALAAADPELLQKLWEGLGYYSRVRNLQSAARQIIEKHNGIFPDQWEEIRKLKGIGDYTAGAIASICFNRPTPAVDGNVLRVLSRITGDPRPVSDEKTRTSVREELAGVYPSGHCGSFTQALMELGEVLCLPNGIPDCAHCPCREFCKSCDGDWSKYPVRTVKKERRKEILTVFLLRNGEQIAIRKRSEKGLLSGMWEFPNLPGELSKKQVKGQTESWNCRPFGIEEPMRSRHIFTHVEWDMLCYVIECGQQSEAFVWVDFRDLEDVIALPTAFRKLINIRKMWTR